MKGFEQQVCWVKCHLVKCRSVRAVEKSTIRDITNGIRANLSPSTVWFKDKPSKNWWACNTLNESHRNKKDLEVVQVWDCIVEEDLKELIAITYTNKMHILFSSSSLKNSTVKCVWLGAIMGWMTFWEVFQEACEWRQSTPKSLMLVYEDNQWS